MKPPSASTSLARPADEPTRASRIGALLAILAILAAVGGALAACTPSSAGRFVSPGASVAPSAAASSPAAASPPAAASAAPSTAPAATPGATPGATDVPRPSASVETSFAASGVRLSVSKVTGGLTAPVFVTGAGTGDGRLYVVEQGGTVRVVEPDGALRAEPFLDISDRVSSGGERGLLGLAFHSGYAANGRFYVDYTDRDGNTVVSELQRSSGDPIRADPASERVLVRIEQPYANHNGGMVAFGPDGYLYVGMGDGGSGGDPENRAQDPTKLLGKILRIDVDHEAGGTPYAIPSDNPFADGAGGRPEIWALGVRNPWRFSFDREAGDLWIGDVGQSTWEEVDRSTQATGGGRGANYGWRLMEGFACYDPAEGCPTGGLTLPVAVYGHDVGCAVTGGYVYRGSTSPVLRGAYLFGDYCSGRIWALDAAGRDRQDPVLLLESGLSISSFGEGDDGELYATDLGQGALYRLVATAP